MKLSKSARIPGWWQGMTGRPTTALSSLLDEVERQGVSPNDRTLVERIWRQMALQRALAHVRQQPGTIAAEAASAPPATPPAAPATPARKR